MTKNSDHIDAAEQPKSGAEIASRFGNALRKYQHTRKTEAALSEPISKQSNQSRYLSELPKRISRFIHPDHPMARDLVARIENHQPIIVLSGPNRTGKSTLAASVAVAYSKAFRWFTAAEMLDEIKASWESKRPWKKPKCPLLVIDEIEKIVSSDWAVNTIDHTITSRYDDCLPTIVTTNLSAEPFKQQASGRLSSRVKEQNSFFNIKQPWWK